MRRGQQGPRFINSFEINHAKALTISPHKTNFLSRISQYSTFVPYIVTLEQAFDVGDDIMNPIKHLTSSHLSLHPQQILAKFNGLLCNEINQLQLVSIPTIESVPQWLVRNGGLFFLLALLCQHDLIKFFDEHYLGQVKQYWREKQYRGEYDCVPRLFCTNIVKY